MRSTSTHTAGVLTMSRPVSENLINRVLRAAFSAEVLPLLFALMAWLCAGQVQAQASGNCRSFDGQTSGIDVANSNLDIDTGHTFSVTAWVKWKDPLQSGRWAGVVTLNSTTGIGDQGQFWLQHDYNNSHFEFMVENNSGAYATIHSTTVPQQEVWYHLAGVYDGDSVYLYINGIRESSMAFSGNVNTFSSDFQLSIGKWSNAAYQGRHFFGDIDAVSVWNIAMTQTEIRDRMCRRVSRTTPGLVAYWRMNEPAGNVVGDVTTNGHDGTASNTSITLSGAPIGDASVYTYGGTTLNFYNPMYNDSLRVDDFSSKPAGIHIYRVDSVPNNTTAPMGWSNLCTTFYFGVFIVNSNGETYKATWYFMGNPFANNPSILGEATRTSNDASQWNDSYAQLNGLSLTLAGLYDRNEFILMEDTTTSGSGGGNMNTFSQGPNAQAMLMYNENSQTNNNARTGATNTTTMTGEQGVGFTMEGTYPNPFSGSFNINVSCTMASDLTAKVLTPDGKEVYQQSFSCTEGSNSLRMDSMDNQAAGMYLLLLTDNAGHSVTKKIVSANQR